MKDSAVFKRLLNEQVKPHWRKLALAMVFMVVNAAMNATNAYLMRPMLDQVFIAKNQQALLIIPLAVLVVAAISGVSAYGQALTLRYVGQRILSDMQIRLFGHLINSDLQLFHHQSAGRLISRFTNDIQMMRHAVSSGLTTLTREMLSIVFLLGVMLYQSVSLTLISLAVFPIAVLPMMRLSKRMRKIAGGTQVELAEFTSRLDEVFQSARVVKAYDRGQYEESRARGQIEKLFTLYFKASRVQAAAAPMMEILSGIAIASVIAYGGAQVIEGVTTPGAFFSFITAFIMAYRPVRALAGLNATFQEGIAAADRFFSAMDARPRVVDAADAVPLRVGQGNIEFRDVHFHYGEGTGGVEDISLTVPPGKKIALVGHSGGGKTTLFNLLLRFYDADRGTICIDGQDIHQVTQSSLREAIAFVPQESALFDDTVRANIAYGRLDASDAEIQAAARAAQAEEFIQRLPQGYETLIGPHGVRLSGGQRQRLSIARAMLKNAPILLLDEATSALDTTSERQVQDALNTLMQGRTTLVIAHRLSTVKHADIIYVIGQGRVLEYGNHEVLLAKRGAYFRLYAEQLVHTP